MDGVTSIPQNVLHYQIAKTAKYYKPGREGEIDYLFHYSLKFYNNVSIFVGLTTLGKFVEY